MNKDVAQPVGRNRKRMMNKKKQQKLRRVAQIILLPVALFPYFIIWLWLLNWLLNEQVIF